MFSKRPSAAIFFAFAMALPAIASPVPQFYYNDYTTTTEAEFVPTLPAIFDASTPAVAPIVEATPTPSVSLPIIEELPASSSEVAQIIVIETPVPFVPSAPQGYPGITSNPPVELIQTPTTAPIVEVIQTPAPTPELSEIYPRVSVPAEVAAETSCSTAVPVQIIATPSPSASPIGEVYAPVSPSAGFVPTSVPNDVFIVTSTLTSTIIATPSAVSSIPAAVVVPSAPLAAAPNATSTRLSMPAIVVASSPAPLLATSALYAVPTPSANLPALSSGLAFIPGTAPTPVATGISRASSIVPAPVEFTGAAQALTINMEAGILGSLFAIVLAML